MKVDLSLISNLERFSLLPLRNPSKSLVEFLLLALCTVRYGKNSPLFLSSLDCPPPLSPPCLPVATFRGVDGVVNPSSVRATVGPPSIFVRAMVQGTELRPNGRRQGSRKQEEACRVTFLQFGPDFPLRSAVVAPLYSAGERSIPAVLFLHLFSNRYPARPFAPFPPSRKKKNRGEPQTGKMEMRFIDRFPMKNAVCNTTY